MKVITLNSDKLISHSRLLAKKILESSWLPDLVIGIKTGGVYVAEPLYGKILEEHPILYNSVSLSRKSSKMKKKFKVSKILKILPYFILNILRNIEVFIFEKTKQNSYINSKEKDLLIENTLKQQLLLSTKILLVDDAIDTGNTVLTIKNKLHEINANLDIKIAVLTTTHKNPYIRADYSLYNRVLLRCPWAQDYKEDKNV